MDNSGRKSLALKARLLHTLSQKATYWVTFFLGASVALYWAALSQDQIGTSMLSWAIPWRLELGTWVILLWLLALPILGLRYLTQHTGNQISRRSLEVLNLLWILATSIFASWWFLGICGLKDPPDPSPFEFVVANRSFLWITALSQVVSLAFLNANRIVVLAVLSFGCLLPGRYAFEILGGLYKTSNLLWVTGQMAAFFVISLLLHADQRQLLKKQIELDAEAENRKVLLTSLEEAKRRTEALLVQKGRLLDSFSHDLFQPLTALEYQIEEARRLTQDYAILDLMDEMAIQQSSMVAMAEAARDLAEAEAGTYPWVPREVPLQRLVSDVIAGHRLAADQANIRLSAFVPPLLVRTDKAVLERIIGNLLSNAIKHSKRSGGRVLVGCKLRQTNAVISVCDNGIGIPEDRLDIIFEEYVQLGNSERDRRKGIGLGLAIVKAFANLLGYTLRVRSEEGKGSIFSIEVPYIGRLPSDLREASLESFDGGILEGMHVVLVEDEPWQRQALVRQLTAWGATVIDAMSRADVLIKIGPLVAAPDVLVTDYRLRRENGHDVLKAVRLVFPQIPIIVLTGNSHRSITKVVTEHDVTIVSKGHLQALRAALTGISNRALRRPT